MPPDPAERLNLYLRRRATQARHDGGALRDFLSMREGATLKLASGEEVRVDVDRDDLEPEEIVFRRTPDPTPSREKLLAWIDHHLATAEQHPAGTTDRFLEADRERPY